jgi:hypothetical protein
MYKIGDWIRAYTNSLRDGGAMTEIGEIVKIQCNSDGDPVRYRCAHAIGGFECLPSDIVELVDIDVLRKKLGL